MAEQADDEQGPGTDRGAEPSGGFRGAFSNSPAFAGFRRAVVSQLPTVEPVDPKVLLGDRATPSRRLQESIESIAMPEPRPDPDLLRELIEHTRKGNEQNEQIIAQNDQLLEGAREGSKYTVRNYWFTIVAAATGVAGVVIGIISLVSNS